MTITIRQASLSDAQYIAEINALTWYDTYLSDEHGVTKDRIEKIPKHVDRTNYIERITKRIQKNPMSYFVACDNDRVV